MNMAITDGLVLMPPPFEDGLTVWSREDGTPGSASYHGQPNAAIVAADQDFGGCLELTKTETLQRLRYKGQTPMRPGMYLRVSAKVKAISGNLPWVRVSAFAGTGSGSHVSGVQENGPSTVLTSYGEVVEISAIVGPGNRPGVDMVWGATPTFGYIGLDLGGGNGGIVRIDDIVIEDVTSVFHRKLMDWVDVRDYGAKGDGLTNDAAAFEAADAAANGRAVLVSAGTYRLNSNVTFESPVRFEGTVTMPDTARLVLTRNYDLESYTSAFGDELTGFKKALQAFFYFTDHVSLDLNGRKVDIPAPIDVADIAGISGSFEVRRVLTNGQLNAVSGTAWNTGTVTSLGTYSPSSPLVLSSVSNVAQIEVGSLITGTGVGREVYVRAKNVAAGTITLSQPLFGAAGTHNFTFRRFRYMLDFSGFGALSKFEITDVEFQCNGFASAIMLAPDGLTFRLADSVVNKPKDRGITSIGLGCQGMFVDQCQFLSNEQSTRAQDRTSIVLNANANDLKIRDNRVVRFAHFAVVNGSGHLFVGNHFFHGDNEVAGVRRGGVVFTQPNVKSILTGNYIDNNFIEWTNEHDATPAFTTGFSFGGLTITGNIFTVSNVASSFRWIVIGPRGPGHFIQGFSMTGNTFRPHNATVDRVDHVDTSYADIDRSRSRNVVIQGNSFNNVSQIIMNPVTIEHDENTAASNWVVDSAGYLPFGGWARNVEAIVAEGPIRNASNALQFTMPYVEVERGPLKEQVHLNWQTAVRGKVHVTIRMDNPR